MLLKSISLTCYLLLKSQKESSSSILEDHGFYQDLPAGPKPNKEKLKQKENISYPNRGLSVSPALCNANSGSCYQFSMGKRIKEIGSLQRSQARQRLIPHLSVLSFPQFENQLVMNFSGNFLNNVISLKICASAIRYAFQV